MQSILAPPPDAQAPRPAPSGAQCAEDTLSEIIAWSRANGSRMGYFAALYTHVEAAVAEAIDKGEFTEPDLLVAVERTFMRRYLDAFCAHRRHAPTSASWRAAFEAADHPGISVVQHLLLGMNAHINFDLAIAVSDALTPEQQHAFEHDYGHMNDLLASLIKHITADIVKFWPLLGWIDRIVHDTDDVIIEFSMTRARQNAWNFVQVLEPQTGAARERTIARFDARAARLAQDVAHPSGIAGVVAIAIRSGERGSVADIIDALHH